MPYQVLLHPAVERFVAKLPRDLRRQIADKLAELAQNPRPHGSIKLSGENAYRIRVRDYRIIYTLQDHRLLVYVIDIGHRGDVYRRR